MGALDSVERLRLAVPLGHREDVGVLLILVRHLVELGARGLLHVLLAAQQLAEVLVQLDLVS